MDQTVEERDDDAQRHLVGTILVAANVFAIFSVDLVPAEPLEDRENGPTVLVSKFEHLPCPFNRARTLYPIRSGFIVRVVLI